MPDETASFITYLPHNGHRFNALSKQVAHCYLTTCEKTRTTKSTSYVPSFCFCPDENERLTMDLSFCNHRPCSWCSLHHAPRWIWLDEKHHHLRRDGIFHFLHGLLRDTLCKRCHRPHHGKKGLTQ